MNTGQMMMILQFWWRNHSIGLTLRRSANLTEPMLERVKVPPVRSAAPSCPAEPRACRRLSSTATSKTLRLWTLFTLGTRRPWGVSIAKPMLWDAWEEWHDIYKPWASIEVLGQVRILSCLVCDVLAGFIHRGIENRKLQEAKWCSLNKTV